MKCHVQNVKQKEINQTAINQRETKRIDVLGLIELRRRRRSQRRFRFDFCLVFLKQLNGKSIHTHKHKHNTQNQQIRTLSIRSLQTVCSLNKS